MSELRKFRAFCASFISKGVTFECCSKQRIELKVTALDGTTRTFHTAKSPSCKRARLNFARDVKHFLKDHSDEPR